jgi:hypothetical protein
MTTTAYTVNLDGVGPVEVTVDDLGEGQPFLLLHGGGGPCRSSRPPIRRSTRSGTSPALPADRATPLVV